VTFSEKTLTLLVLLALGLAILALVFTALGQNRAASSRAGRSSSTTRSAASSRGTRGRSSGWRRPFAR
jgi:hypothetical protein